MTDRLKIVLSKVVTQIMFDFMTDGKLNDPNTLVHALEEAVQVIRDKFNIPAE